MAFIKNENFKTDKPFSDLSVEQKIKEQSFLKGADNHIIRQLDPNDEKTFREVRINLNEYEEGVVVELAKKERRSKRFILREAVKKGLREMMSLF